MNRFLLFLFAVAPALPIYAAGAEDEAGAGEAQKLWLTVDMNEGGTFRFTAPTGRFMISLGEASASIVSVTVNGEDWSEFLTSEGCITINDPDSPGTEITEDATIVVSYQE